MKKTSFILLSFPLVFSVACGKSANTISAEYKPGDRTSVQVDFDGDSVSETLTVSSTEAEPEFADIGPFDIEIRITDPRGNVLYSDDFYGEAGWWSLDVADFQLEGQKKSRQAALIRSGCSGTGTQAYALFIFYPPGGLHMYHSGDGNEGFYDADNDGITDALVSVYRMQNLGVIGVCSPWLPAISKPEPEDGWETVDITFQVLEQDEVLREEWIKGVGYALEALRTDFPGEAGSEHLRYLEMLLDALKANDMVEAANIYYTAF